MRRGRRLEQLVAGEALKQFHRLNGVVLHGNSQAAFSVDIHFLMVTTEDAIETCYWLEVYLTTRLLPEGVVAANRAREHDIVNVDEEEKFGVSQKGSC